MSKSTVTYIGTRSDMLRGLIATYGADTTMTIEEFALENHFGADASHGFTADDVIWVGDQMAVVAK